MLRSFITRRRLTKAIAELEKSVRESEESLRESEESAEALLKAPETTRAVNRSIREQSARLTLDNILEQNEYFHTALLTDIIIKTLADENARVTIAEHLLITVAINHFLESHRSQVKSALTAALERIEEGARNDALTRLANVTVTPNSYELRFLEKLCELFHTQLQDDAKPMKNSCNLAFARIDTWINNVCVFKRHQLRNLQSLAKKNHGLMTLYACHAIRSPNRFSAAGLNTQDQEFLQPFKDTYLVRLSELGELSHTEILSRSSEIIRESNLTIIPEEKAPALDSHALQSQYSITAVTWNAGSSYTPKEAIVELANAIHPIDAAEDAPDIMVICLQEAKKTWMLNEDVAERIIKRYGDCYEILHADGLLAFTHLKEVSNLTNWSRTHLVVAYKKSRLSAEDIKIEKEGTYTPRSTRNPLENFDNKGGLYLVLNVHGIRVGIVGAHLDSFCTTRRQAQARELRRLCESHEKTLNSMMFMGDLNERLTTDVLQSAAVDQEDRNAQPLPEEEAIPGILSRSVDRLESQDSHLHGLEFLRPTDYTYIKETPDRQIPYDPRRSRPNLGALDNIGIQNFGRWIKRLQHVDSSNRAVTPVRPKDSSGKEVSDHGAIIGKYTLLLPLSNEQKTQFVAFLGNYQAEISSGHSVEEQTTLLQQLHNQLNDTNHPDCFIAYFEYAILMRQQRASENDRSFPYYLKHIDLDIIFIVSHLDALEDQVISLERYQNLIFGTCVNIESHLGNNGQFMSDIHQQLLSQDTKCPFALRISLLALFKNWFSENQITVDDQNYILCDQSELTYSLRDIDTQLNNSPDNNDVMRTFHAWLNAADNPALVKAYFQHAIATKQPAFEGDRSFPYHLKEIKLVKKDIKFIVSHLGVLRGQANEVAPYRDLIFGTCEAIEADSGDTGEFMQIIYTQLLDEQISGVNKLKAALLSPFRQWLDDHNVPRERYTLSGNESYFTVRKLGLFAGREAQATDLSPFERAQLR